MDKFVYDIFDTIETPTFVLSNVYHHHIGVIPNVDADSINMNFNMASAQEISFEVHKEVDGKVCDIWDDIVGLKYVYVPEFKEYYKADVTLNEDDKTVKNLTLTSAGEYELSNKKIVSLEINTESDILQKDYITTVFYDPDNPRGSLIDRALADKAPDWSVGHVDETLRDIQRTFSVNGQTIYDFLTNTVAKEINCLFTFDSVNRVVNAYDLYNKCTSCGYRGEFLTTCPKCGSTEFIKGYGKDSNIFISYNNYSEKITVDGSEDKVKNCFKVTGGDDNMNAAIRNCNPNGSHYIYSFSDADYDDMPDELVQKLDEYGELYDQLLPEYQDVVEQYYNNLNCYHYYKTTMMPRLNGTHWEAEKGYNVGDLVYVMTLPSWCYLECIQAGISGDTEFDATHVTVDQEFVDGTVIWKAHKNIITVPSAQQTLDAIRTYLSENLVYFLNTIPTAITEVNNEVKSIAGLAINNIFRIEVILDDKNKIEGNTWYGNMKVYNTGDSEDKVVSETPVTATLQISTAPMDYINYMSDKVEKRLSKKDTEFSSLFDIDIPRDETTYEYIPSLDTEFKDALKEYGLDSLSSFSKSYQGCIETLISNGVTDEDSNIVGYKLYDPLYVPYYARKGYIDDEMAIREATVNEYEALYKANYDTMEDYHKTMDLHTFLGDDLYKTLYNYIREDDYNNTNYVSTGLSDGELLSDAQTLLEIANDELVKAKNMQYVLSDSLTNLLNTEEFKSYKDRFNIGDYIICEADEKLYRLRLIGVSYGFNSPDKVNVTFSNYVAVEDYFSDAQNILATAKSMSTSYGAVMHQVDKSAAVTDEVTDWIEDSLSSAVANITNNDNEEVTIDENGIIAREFDDMTNTYSPEQLRITHNIIAFTQDNWEHSTLGIGKSEYTYYDTNLGWITDVGYGVNAKFVNSGYITGTQIVAGEIYSKEYEAGHYGSHINLDDGSFDLAGGGLIGRWNSDTHSYDLNYTGDVEGVLDVGVGSHLGTWTVYADGLYSGTSVIKPNNINVTGVVTASDFQMGSTLLSNILAGKQPLLNAGQNITLTPEQDGTVTISAAGGGGVSGNTVHLGVGAPSSSIGNNHDLYFSLEPDPTGFKTLTYNRSSNCSSVNATSDDGYYTIEGSWWTDRYEHTYTSYRINGLTEGNEYLVSFTLKMSEAVTEYDDSSELFGITVQKSASWETLSSHVKNGGFAYYENSGDPVYLQSLKPIATKQSYQFRFTAMSTNYFGIYTDSIVNDSSYSIEISDLYISDGTATNELENMYVKDDGTWVQYNPGLKYWIETQNRISRSQIEALPDNFTCDSRFLKTEVEWEVDSNGSTYRTYEKYPGRAICAKCTYWDWLFGAYYRLFYGTIYISTNRDYVKYSTNGGQGWITDGITTTTINGVTFYISGSIENVSVSDYTRVDETELVDIGEFEDWNSAVNYLLKNANIKAGIEYRDTGISIGTDYDTLWTCDSKWLRTSLDVTIADEGSTREFVKNTNGITACCKCRWADYGTYYQGWICLSNVQADVAMTMNGSTAIVGDQYDYDGTTFYYCGNGMLYGEVVGGRITDDDGLIDIGTFDSYQEALDYFLNKLHLNEEIKLIFWGGTRYSEDEDYPYYVDEYGNIHAKSIIVDSVEATSISDNDRDVLSEFVGATSSTDGMKGLVPKPLASNTKKFLCSNGDWERIDEGSTDIFEIFDTLSVNSRYSVGSLNNNVFTFDVSETDNSWSSTVTAYNDTAYDLTDTDKLRIAINITSRSDYGAFFVTLSQIKYTWGDSQWVTAYANVDSSIKITESGVYDIDVSSLTGNYYIYIGAATGKATVTHGDCNNSQNGTIIGTVTSFKDIKYGGGTTVIANPLSQPTDVLRKLRVGDTTYEVSCIKEVTSDEYDALPSTKNTDKTLYLVLDNEDIFDGNSTITLLGTNGITTVSSSVTNGVGTLSAYEYSAGHEGFNIALENLTIGHTYNLDFDFQFTSAQFIGTDYRCAYIISQNVKSDYDNYTSWTENLPRDLANHHHSVSFTATATTMHIAFNLDGCSDSVNNYFTMSNIICVDTAISSKIMYNGNRFGGGSGSGGASAISDLTDVDLTNLSDGQILKYNSTSHKWENTDESGGGPSGGAVTLYKATDTTKKTFQLSDDWDNYETLLITMLPADPSTDGVLPNTAIVNVASITEGMIVGFGVSGYTWYKLNPTTIDKKTFTYWITNGSSFYIDSVVGIKAYGGSGGGGGMSSTELYTGSTQESSITLSESFRNYDYIHIMAGNAQDSSVYWRDSFYRVDELSNGHRIGIIDDVKYLWYSITDDTHLSRTGSNGSYYIASIYGLKEGGGGGSEVIPNPQDTPTDTLDSIEIDGTVYGIGGSEAVEMNWATYNALPSATKNNGTTYYVPDAPSSGGGGGASYNGLEWDFTKARLDVNSLENVSLSNVNISANGLVFDANDCYAEFDKTLLAKGMTYEIDIASMSINDITVHNCLFRYQNVGSNQNAGLIYRYQTQTWSVWDSTNGWQDSTLTNKDYFNNCTLKVVIESDGKWKIYKDDTLVFSPPLAMVFEGTDSFGIGSPNASANDMTITSARFYVTGAESSGGGGGGGGNTTTYGTENPSVAGTDGDTYYLLNGQGKKRALFIYMVNQWVCVEGSPKGLGFAKIYTDAANTDSQGSATVAVDPSEITGETTVDHFFKSLKALYFSGSNWYETTTTFTSYEIPQLSYSWGSQSGSTRQWFDIYYISELEDINILSNWTTYTQTDTYTFQLPAGAQSLNADDFILDFRNVRSGGGSSLEKTNVVKSIVNGELNVYLPVGGRGYDMRILYSV